MITEKDITNFHLLCKKISDEISKDIVGQKDIVEGVLISMIAGGNILLEGVPGLGKTRLVRTIGKVFDLPFSRIQFTPDLMPADVVGTNIVVKDPEGNSVFKFQPGPVFSNIVLADEINRATPKTQSALLEAMQEHTVTVAGTSRSLSEPFFVLATQNPIEQEGTYPLPEAQMDRFMFKLLVMFPKATELTDIVRMTQKKVDMTATKVVSGDELLVLREVARNVPIADTVMDYAMRIITATHPELDEGSETAKKYIRFGSSPRGAQALISGAKVKALMQGRYNLSCDDIETLFYPVLRHRIALNFEAVTSGLTSDMIISEILKETVRGI